MTQADRMLSMRPTNTPVDTTRRRFLFVAAFASVVGAGSLAVAAMAPNDVPKAVTVPKDGANVRWIRRSNGGDMGMGAGAPDVLTS
jgi:hypothetical protein